jgi:hypothetical protein
MRRSRGNVGITVVAMIAFWIAAIVCVWRLVEEGARIVLVAPAICFPVGAVLLTVSVLGLRRRREGR